MVEISVRSPDRFLSARLTNAVVEAYLQNQVSSFADLSVQATSWMQKRVAELRDEAIAADRAVQEYKATHNILSTDKGKFSEQQLGEISVQLTAARGRVADAQAKFDRVRSITTERLGDDSLTEALENSVIVGLRRQYLDARRRESEWSTRYGSNHAAAVNARSEMNELQRSIQNELNRISQTYRSELEVAKANEIQISQQLATLASESAATNSDGIMLRALQSAADSYRTIYENFLQRYTQAVQDQSFPIPGGRVITPALPPQRKSQPKIPIVMGVGLIAGLAIGMGLALLWEITDRGLRTPTQIKATTGHDCLGLLPRQAGRIGTTAGAEAQPSLRQLATRPSMLRHVVDQPNSAYAEGMRGIALRTVWQRRAPGSQVIGCFALQAGEGASTVAANLAYSLTDAGYSTLLVDLDLRQADLTRAMTPSNAGGAAEVAEGGIPLDQAVWRDPQTGLRFLPAAAGQSAARPTRVLAPARMDRLLNAMRSGYDRIVIDLPALGGTADVAVIAELLDSLVVVSTWGVVSGATLNEMLENLHDSRDKVIGVVLNRAELGKLGQYGAASLVPKTAAALGSTA
jgi:succinoglycan biosynthesis transport protein ExoP